MTPPPSAVYDDAYASTTTIKGKDLNGSVAKMTLNGDTTVNGTSEAGTKLLADFEGKWDTFNFAPIRESQVSRAMTRRYFADLDTCKPLSLRPSHLTTKPPAPHRRRIRHRHRRRRQLRSLHSLHPWLRTPRPTHRHHRSLRLSRRRLLARRPTLLCHGPAQTC